MGPSGFSAVSGIPKKTAKRIAPRLRGKGIITVLAEGGGQRPMVYAFPRLPAITVGSVVTVSGAARRFAYT